MSSWDFVAEAQVDDPCAQDRHAGRVAAMALVSTPALGSRPPAITKGTQGPGALLSQCLRTPRTDCDRRSGAPRCPARWSSGGGGPGGPGDL